MVKRIEKLGTIIAKYAFLIFVILYSSLNILFTVRQYNAGDNAAHYFFGLTPIHFIVVGILFLLLVMMIRKGFYGLKDRHMLLVFLVVCVLIGLYWILSNPQVLADFSDDYNCLRAARLVGEGDYGPLGYQTYINTYPHNLTLVSYFMIFTRLFGENANLVIRLVNLAFVIVGYLSLYGICDRLFKNSTVNKVLVVLMFLSMQFVFYAFYIYGNVLSYATALFSVWFFVRYMQEEKVVHLIVSLISIVFSASIKNNSLIILVAEAIFLALHVLEKKKYICILLLVFALFGQYLGTTGVEKFWAKRADYDYSNRLPKICWIAYGLNYDERHPGGYMNEFEMYHFENGFNPEFTTERAKTFIDGVLNSFKEKPYLIPRFYLQKFLVSFANSEYETFAQYRSLELSDFNQEVVSGKINDALNVVWDATSTIVSMGLIGYLVYRFKKITLLELIGAVIVFGGFLFHAFWETKAIYLYQYYMYLLPYVAYGITLLVRKINVDDVAEETTKKEQEV